jgi:hypothetical protein
MHQLANVLLPVAHPNRNVFHLGEHTSVGERPKSKAKLLENR